MAALAFAGTTSTQPGRDLSGSAPSVVNVQPHAVESASVVADHALRDTPQAVTVSAESPSGEPKAGDPIAQFVPGCPVTILPADGSTSGNSRAPMPNFAANRGVYLILASEVAASGLLPGAVPGAIGWRYSTAPSAATTATLKIYLENTSDTTNTKSTTWTTAISTMTLVSSGTATLPASTAPFDITLSGGSPFTYTGGALYVGWDWSGGVARTGTIVACNASLAASMLSNNTGGATIGPASAFRGETRFTPSVGAANDRAIDQVMSFGSISNGLSGAQTIQAVVSNKGTSAATNVPVTLNITGANTFTNTVNVPSLSACGGAALVTFAPWTPASLGSNTVTASVPADDANPNNSKSKPLDVTQALYSYKYPGSVADGGVGLTGAVGQFVGRFFTTGATQVDSITTEFEFASATTYRFVIYGDDGTAKPGAQLFVEGADRTVAAPGPVTVRLPAPVAVGPGNFFAGIEQTNTINVGQGFDNENPIRAGAFFLSTALNTGPWSDFAPANPFKLNIGVTVGACISPPVVNVTPNSASVCQGGSIQFTCNVTGGTGTLTYQWTENGIDIGGATSSTYTATKASAGSFTYNCKVTDDAGCTNVQDATASTGTWLASGSACSDGNPCTGPDTCGGSGCVSGPNPCEDSNACTNDICDGMGGCTYTAVNCNDNSVCTADSCNTGTGCVHVNVNVPCTDSNPCTVGDACSAGVCVPGPAPAPVQFCNAGFVTINDGTAPTPASPYPSSITVSGLPTILCSSSVALNGLAHTFPDDIDMLLAGPAGQNAIILSDVGGGTPISGVNLTLSDSAALPIPDAGPITSGNFKPTNVNAGATGTESWPAPAPTPLGGSALSVFTGSNPNGNWRLFIVDDENQDSGTMTGGWCVTVSAAPCFDATDCNDANACTTDTCSAGSCSHTAVTCSDGDVCTDDVCNPGTGLCSHPATNCDDANPCTTDSCNAGSGCAHAAIAPPVVVNLKIGTLCSPACTNKHSIVWDAVSGGPTYDIIYGFVEVLHSSGLTASVGGCLGDNLVSPASDDSDSPSAGQGFWYLSRATACGPATGTYNEGGNQIASRDPLIPAPPVDCSRP